MIKGFQHKGLERFFQTGGKAGIPATHAERRRLILGRLNAATSAEDMNLAGLFLHPLSGDRKSIWSARVSGNWCTTFVFEDGNAIEVVLRGEMGAVEWRLEPRHDQEA